MNKFEKILKELVFNTGAEGAILISPDGLSIASTFNEGYDEERAAAMGAAILSLSERVVSELNKGILEQIYVKGKDGYVLFTGIDDFAVLGIMTDNKVKLGLLLMEVKKAVKEISNEVVLV